MIFLNKFLLCQLILFISYNIIYYIINNIIIGVHVLFRLVFWFVVSFFFLRVARVCV